MSAKESAEAVDSVPAAHPIPDGHSANRSLSAIEPVSATAKRKLENGEQRPAPETFPARAEIPKITGQRLGRATLTRGNVAGCAGGSLSLVGNFRYFGPCGVGFGRRSLLAIY